MKICSRIIALIVNALIALNPTETASQTTNHTQPTVVFTGNSICELWGKTDRAFFAENGIVNTGISGETSRQILQRFERDVISLSPDIVVIISPSSNDVAQNEGPVTIEQMVDNVAEMIALVQETGAIPVLTSNLPCGRFSWRPNIKPAAEIIEVNKRLLDLATDKSVVYIDLHAPMRDENDALDKDYTYDGCHPSKAGYDIMKAVMMPVIEDIISSYTTRP